VRQNRTDGDSALGHHRFRPRAACSKIAQIANLPLTTTDFARAQRAAKSYEGKPALGYHSIFPFDIFCFLFCATQLDSDARVH
jgi:hypothetical protein